MTVPELTAPAECYYNKQRSAEYTRNSRIAKIQRELTLRAVELLEVSESSLILDLGCGSGLSGEVLGELGHCWIGTDIALSMLNLAKTVPGTLGVVAADMGSAMPFQDDSFDYVISISAIQWLLQSYKTEHIPSFRVKFFFENLYRIVRKKAVIQFYCDKKGTSIITRAAVKAGFYGGMVVDASGTRNEKRFLVLSKERDRMSKAPRKSGNRSRLMDI